MEAAATLLRPAVPFDAVHIAEYHHQCWLHAFTPILGSAITEQVQPRTERWHQWLADGSGFTTVVATDQSDTPIAHTTVSGSMLVHLFVDPPHWRKGLGRLLLGVGEDLIRSNGYDQAELHTRVGNARAIALYESAGWTMTDRTVLDHDDRVSGLATTEHVLLKDLGPSSIVG